MAKLDATKKSGIKIADTDDDFDDILSGGDDEEIAEGAVDQKVPRRVRLLKDVDTGDDAGILPAGSEFVVTVDKDGDVYLKAEEGDKEGIDGFMLEAEEFEISAFVGEENQEAEEVGKESETEEQQATDAVVQSPIQPEYESKLRNAQDWLLKTTLHRRTCELQLERAKTNLKEAEEQENAAADRVEKIMADPGTRELFDKAAPPDEDNPTSAEDDDQSWRETQIVDLPGMTAAIAATLADNPELPIRTMGDLSDWTAKKGNEGNGNPLLLIPKVGKGKADKILAAHDKFWDEWRKK